MMKKNKLCLSDQEKFLHRTLKNRMQVIGVQRRFSDVCSVAVLIDYGSRHEKDFKKFGIAHFIEHMLFKGTREFSQRDIARIVEGNGGEMNAYTSKSNTFYYISSTNDNMRKNTDILISMMQNPLLLEKDFNLEKQIIIEEVNTEKDVFENVAENMYGEHVYSTSSLGRPIGGDEKTVSSINLNDLLSTHKEIYCGENLTFGISGNFDKEDFENVCEKLESFTSGEKAEFKKFDDRYLPSKSKAVFKDFSQNYIYVFSNAPKISDKDFFASKVVNAVLGGGTNSRLYQRIREEKGFAYSIYSRSVSMKDCGLWTIFSSTGCSSDKKDSRAKECVEEIKKIIEEIGQEIFLSEIEEAKQYITGSVLHCCETSLGSLESEMYYLKKFGKGFHKENFIKKILEVEKKDVDRVLAKYFKKDAWKVFLAGPSKNIFES